MAIKKNILDGFLKPSSHYSDNKKNLRSIFIDRNDDNYKKEHENFLESTLLSPSEAHTNLTQSTYKLNTENNAFNEDSQIKTTHKPNTNRTHEMNTKLTQTEHISVLKNTKHTQSKDKLNTKLNTQKTQTRHEKHTKLTQTEHISTLVGVQRIILLFIFDECKKARSHITEPMSILYISSSLDITLGSIKTSIARLCDKQFIRVHSFKNGRGGWSSYTIPDEVYNELLQIETRHKLHTNLPQMIHKADTNLYTQPDTNDSRRRDLLNVKTSSNIIEWVFDITNYEKFGFTKTRLKQLASVNMLTMEEVQQSLVEFEYDFSNNTLPFKITTSPINYLMGGLIKGSPYTSDAYQKEINRAAEEMKARYEARQREQQKTSVLAWFEGLKEDEKRVMESIMPTHLKIRYRIDGLFEKEVFGWVLGYFYKTKGFITNEEAGKL